MVCINSDAESRSAGRLTPNNGTRQRVSIQFWTRRISRSEFDDVMVVRTGARARDLVC